jgi:uncharacterized protein
MRGQFLERATVIPAVEGVLEGLSHRGTRAPPLLIVPPPPGAGGMDHALGAELAWAASRGGHPTLRFNFRGVGASPGRPGDADSQVQDIEAALRTLAETAGGAACAVVSLGGSAHSLLRLADGHPSLAGIALVSPEALPAKALAGVRIPLLVLLGEAGPEEGPELAAAVRKAGGRLLVVPGADARLHRNLPEVGRSLARWLEGLAPSA